MHDILVAAAFLSMIVLPCLVSMRHNEREEA